MRNSSIVCEWLPDIAWAYASFLCCGWPLHCSVPNSCSTDVLVWRGYLAHPINPTKSAVKVAGKRIELKLRKLSAEQWEELLDDRHEEDCWEKPSSKGEVADMEVDGRNLKGSSSSTEVCNFCLSFSVPLCRYVFL